MPVVNLGDKARDNVTGYEGICIARTQWLNGCIRVTLLPDKLNKDGEPHTGHTFDEPQLVVIEAGKIAAGSSATGGPIPEPQRCLDLP